MRFTALACDYDGTLASHDRIGAETLAALERARGAGMRLILVTGRTFFELIRVCEPLDLFDAVVAENGGVLYFPATGVLRDQAPPPPPRLLAELDGRGVPYQPGRVIVGTWRAEEPRVRDALAMLGVRMEIVYNRAALMLLPTGVSKGAGVREAIRALGLSFHDVLALGDAENDLDFFAACGWTACPINGVPELKDRADWVFPGEDGAAIAQAITGPILGGLLPVARSRRHQLAVGWSAETAEEAMIPERGVNVLIQGDPLSGKSWLAGVLIERLLGRRYAVCVIDPEGDYHVLAPLPGVSWMEVRDRSGWGRALDRFTHDPSACVVLDLSTLPPAEKTVLVEAGLALICEQRRRQGTPHWVVLDEAHYVLQRDGVADAVLGIEDKGFCLVTYRASRLRESVLKATDVFVFARTTAPEELDFVRGLVAGLAVDAADVVTAASRLPQGEFLLIRTEEAGARTRTFVAAPRMTSHVRHLRKYADGRLPEARRFIFRSADGRQAAAAGSLKEFLHAVAHVGEESLRYHADRGDFSRWVLDVFADREVGRQLAKIERRWSRDEIRDLRHAIERLLDTAIGRAEDRPEEPRRGR
jgi:hydroxymethylpyrimidine pyrophosphatase-like HAD family hydrolase